MVHDLSAVVLPIGASQFLVQQLVRHQLVCDFSLVLNAPEDDAEEV